jgi:hypothetical protein
MAMSTIMTTTTTKPATAAAAAKASTIGTARARYPLF